MKMVFTEVMGARDRLIGAFPDDEVVTFDGPLDADGLVHEAEEASVLSVFIRTAIGREVIDSLPNLRMINTRSVGFDHIDVRHALSKGIAVTHVAEYGPHVVAEHAFCLLLACARNLVDADRYVKEGGGFDFHPFRGLELRDKTLGVLGTGSIGAEVVHMARGFGMQVVAFDKFPNVDLARDGGLSYRSLEEVLRESDFLSIHLPLTDGTRGLIGREELRMMREGAVLVNTARGGIVDEAALSEVLADGHLYAAGLDVLNEEDSTGSDPLIRSDRTTITPHIGFYTSEAVGRMLDHSIGIIEAFRSGKVEGRVPIEFAATPRQA